MSVSFIFTDIKFPINSVDFEGYVRGDIKIISGDVKFLKCDTFAGVLPSCAPYFIYNVIGTMRRGTKELGVERFKEKETTVLKYPTLKSLFYIFENEIGTFSATEKWIFGHLRDLWQHFSYDTLINYDLLEQFPNVMRSIKDKSEFWKFEFKLKILKYYKNIKKIEELVELTYVQLEALSTCLDQNPILLCFDNNGYFKYRLSYESFMLLKIPSHKYSPEQVLSINILDFIYSYFIEDLGDTLFDRDNLKTEMSRKKRLNIIEKTLFADALKWLIEKEQVISIDDILLTLPRFQRQGLGIKTKLLDIIKKSGEVSLRTCEKVPFIPKTLTKDQQKIARHMIEDPICIIIGAPGRGKTVMIEFAMRAFTCASVVSFVGTVVTAHRQRMGGREEVSNTAHKMYKTAKYTYSGQAWLNMFEVLVWDEGSNVEEDLFYKTIMAFKRLKKLIIVLDPNQISPIGYGSPCLDLIKNFPQYCHELTENLRVDKTSLALAESISNIVKNTPRFIQWSRNIMNLQSLTILNEEVNYQNLFNLLKHIIKYPNIYKVKHVNDIQFIVFTNDVKKEIDFMVESILRKLKILKVKNEVVIRKKDNFVLYVGCKITIKKTFKAVYEDADKNSIIKYDEIRNQDFGIVKHICAYKKEGYIVDFDVGNGMIKTMAVGKKLQVDPYYIHLGHAITSNAAQALEFNTVIQVIKGRYTRFVDRSHLYVMSSRARSANIVIGQGCEEAFNSICAIPIRRKNTFLNYILRQDDGVKMFKNNAIPDDIFNKLLKTDNLTLMSDVETCAPTQNDCKN
jgi:uncharacterized protein YrrD